MFLTPRPSIWSPPRSRGINTLPTIPLVNEACAGPKLFYPFYGCHGTRTSRAGFSPDWRTTECPTDWPLGSVFPVNQDVSKFLETRGWFFVGKCFYAVFFFFSFQAIVPDSAGTDQFGCSFL